jgi:MFS family permease
MQNKLKANIYKIYILNFFMMFLVMIPIIVPYWQSLGLTIQDIYKLQAIFGLTVILLDVPTGYISDLFGRRNCLIVVGIFNAISYQFLTHGSKFHHFVMFEICAAIAVSLYSGCDIALIYDSLDAVNDTSKSEMSFLGKRIFFSQIGETFGSLLGGICAAYSLSLPGKVNSLTALIPLCVALTLVEPPRTKMNNKKHWENIKFIFRSLFKHSTLLSTMIIFNIAYGFSTFAAVWAFQSYWKELNIPIIHYGYLWAGFNLTVAIFARMAQGIERKCSSLAVVFMVGLSPIFAYFFLGLTYYRWSFAFAIFFALTRSLNSVVVQDGINARVPNSMRATTNSFCSLGMRGVFVVLGPIIGASIDNSGVHQTFLNLGWLYVAFFLLIMIPLALQRKKFRPVYR